MEPKTYTDSALCDALKNAILKRKEQVDIIDKLWTVRKPTFFYDPSQDIELLDEFLKNQKKYKRMLKRAVKEIVGQRHKFVYAADELDFINSLRIKFTDSKAIKMSEWGSDYEGVPISTECVVISTGKEQTYTKSAIVKCQGCSNQAELYIDPFTNKLSKPPKCPKEDCSYYKLPMRINPDEYETGPYKLIEIQEPMDEAKHGSPRAFTAEIKDGDVTETFIGQRKKIVAAFTSVLGENSINDILIKCFSVNDATDDYISKATDEEIKMFKEWVKDPTFIQLKLCRSVAPEIYDEVLAKEVMILCVAGGTRVDSLRGDINGLLIGNPSVGKSKLLRFVVKMIQKSAFVNCATASGAGITIAYDDKIKAPRIGPMALCDEGILAMDELGKLRKEDLKYSLESMEDGTIHYDKGGFDIWVNARTPIIAGANPKYDYYDFSHNIIENINLIGPLLSRFDIIINMIRDNNEDTTKKRMQHIDEFRELGEKKFVEKHGLIPSSMLIKYFTYIRGLRPKMSKEASLLRQEFYERIRKIQQAKGSIRIDERFYESLYRMATAIAKLLISDTVTADHMQLAIDIKKESLQTFKMNVSEGETTLNMQEEATSMEGAFRHCVQEVQAKMQKELVSYDGIIEEMVKRYPRYWNSESNADKFFGEMENDKIILKTTHGEYYL